MPRILHLLAGLAALAAGAQCRAQDGHDLLMRGRNLTDDQAVALEAAAGEDPEDLSSRVQLLGYYFPKSIREPDAREAHQQLVLWLIEHHPDSTLHESPETHVIETLNPDGYREAKELWLKTAKEHADSAQVQGNAAEFFLLFDKALAEEFLLRAEQLEPDEPQWAQQLGRLYQLQSQRAEGEVRVMLADKALAEFERAFALVDELHQFYALADLAAVAFDAGQDEKAKKYAQQLLEMVEGRANDWNAGNAVHQGNLMLGRVALRAGDLDAAKAFLLKAGETPGSPQLNSFGPNMALAKELLEQGERDVVLEYFGLCKKFWDRDELDDWSAAVNAGEVPDFGANLVY